MEEQGQAQEAPWWWPSTWPFWLRLILTFLVGAATVLAFAPFGYFLAAILGPLLFLILLGQSSQSEAFRLGWGFGFGLMSVGVNWLQISIGQFGGVNQAMALVITLAFCIAIALYYALIGWLVVKVKSWVGPSLAMIAIPAAWVLSEWMRGWVLSGFPWLSLGYSQIDSPLAAYAPFLGVYGLSFLVILSATLVLQWRQLWAIPLLLTIWVADMSLKLLSWTESAGDPITVSLIQGNIDQAVKWHPEMFQPTLDLYLGETATLSSQLVIWPETAVPAFSYRVKEALLDPLDQRLGGAGQDLLLGIPVSTADGRYYNSMMRLGASGPGVYHKKHLVPFGEFMPLRVLLEPLMKMLAIPMSQFSAGEDKKPLLSLAGHQAGISICYEDAFGDEVDDALPEAAFLVNASNDAWFGDSLAPHQHLEIARMRALETERYLLRATNTGVSAIIDSRGGLGSVAPQFERAVLTDMIQPLSGLTPYARLGHWPIILFSSALLLLVFIRRDRPEASSRD